MPMKFPTDSMALTLVESSPNSFTITLRDCGEIIGELAAEKSVSFITNSYPEVYEVTYVSVKEDGYGPILYDVAMEFATFNKVGGLTSDKNVRLTEDAKRLWQFYYNNRHDISKEKIVQEGLDQEDCPYLFTIYYAEDRSVSEKLETNGQLYIVELDRYDEDDDDDLIDNDTDYDENDTDLDEVELSWFLSL